MEDYCALAEMQDLKNKRVIAFVEDDENFAIDNLINSQNELIPIRFSYDLSNFSKDYIELTKELFIYYFTKENTYKNELLRLKKHFVHYQRYPEIAYIPINNKGLIQMLEELDVICFNTKEDFLSYLNNN